MKENVKAAVRQVLTGYLEQNKYRKTPERFAVLDAVYSFANHFSIQDLSDRLAEDNFPVSRATLYNTINLFIQLRLVVCHRLLNCTMYEASYSNKSRGRQVCTVCGKINDFDSPEINQAVDNMHLNRFRKDVFTLYVYGVCSACRAKMTRRARSISKTSKDKDIKNINRKNENRKS